MDIFSLANRSMLERGYNLYKAGAVKKVEKVDDDIYVAKVQGEKLYSVTLKLEHLVSSSCNCAYGKNNRRTLCKHKVAAYFAIFPEVAERCPTIIEERDLIDVRLSRSLKELIAKRIDRLTVDEMKEIIMDYWFKEELENQY